MTVLRRFLWYRLLTLSSFAGVLLCYWLAIGAPLPGDFLAGDYWVRAGLGVGGSVLFGWSLLRSVRRQASVDTMVVADIRPLESAALPTYIGLCVITLDLSGLAVERAGAILLVLYILWWQLERVFYFNPVWLCLGYRFYEVRTSGGNTCVVISRVRDRKNTTSFERLLRINEYTFLEVER